MSRWTEKSAAMCQENISAARVGGRAVDGRRPRCTSHVAWRKHCTYFSMNYSGSYLEHCEEGSAEFDQLVFKDDLKD